MATVTAVRTFEKTMERTREWLEDVRLEGGYESEELALIALKGVLQTLRDRLIVEEAADLAAQLPLLMKGIFYEGFQPAVMPVKMRSREEFLGKVADRIRNDMEAEIATRAVFIMLKKHVSVGEMEDVIGDCPDEMKDLWM